MTSQNTPPFELTLSLLIQVCIQFHLLAFELNFPLHPTAFLSSKSSGIQLNLM